jgi:tetratricopeptide (TPR) repeat protein
MLRDRRNRCGLALLVMVIAAPAHAAATKEAADAAHYKNCLAATSDNPAAALKDATAWARAGGGAPAEHCAAAALVGLHRYGEAGPRLDALARAKNTPAGLRAALFDQAGNAFLLAGDGAHAVASLSAALTLSGNDPDLLADLARAQALVKNWREVVLDLNAALAIAPHRPDLLVLRASAHRALGQLESAGSDIEAALAIRRDAGALLERGLLRRQIGDIGGARSDFRAALADKPTDAVAAAARENLDALSDGAPVKPRKRPGKP